jgi:nucleotide-binding universal stress UspA family protein
MLKSILLALDGTPAALESRKLALALARKHGAAILALSVVDPDVIAPVEPTPMGGDAYKQHKDAVLIERAKTAAAEFGQAFVGECRAAGGKGDATVVVGEAAASLVAASAQHDVVMLGVDSDFSGSAAALSPLIVDLLRNNPRPLVVSPRQAVPEGKTVVAYDGSIPAMRAMQLFCAMQLRADSEAAVVSIDPDPAKAAAQADVGARFLCERGYKAAAQPLTAGGDIAGVIIEAAKAAGAGMIVAGAYGHRGWREWLLGTTTEHLLAASPTHVFVHH